MIRRWTPADSLACLAIFQVAVRAGTAYARPKRMAWANIDYSFAKWRERQRRFITLVAERDGRIVGFTEFRRDGHVHMLFVHPSAMRQGLAPELLAAGDAIMERKGVTRRDCWASRNARPVFERAGYRTVGGKLRPAGDQWLLAWRMVRR